jgi:hypothetical protein
MPPPYIRAGALFSEADGYDRLLDEKRTRSRSARKVVPRLPHRAGAVQAAHAAAVTICASAARAWASIPVQCVKDEIGSGRLRR